MKSRLLILICICFLLLLAVIRGRQLISLFGQNLANALIHNSFSLEQADAVSRQRAMSASAMLLDYQFPGFPSDSEITHEIAMLPAALRGLYYHRLEEWKNAAYWYRVAGQGKPIPEKQQQILISPWMELEPAGDFILSEDGNVEGWHIRADTAPGAQINRNDRGTLEFSCHDILEEPRKVALEWKQAFDNPYHHTLVLQAKAEIGTVLNLETVADGEWTRHLAYAGSGEWEEFVFPIESDHIQYIYLIAREDKNAPEKSCMAEIDSITFLLDETIADDRSR